MYSFSADESGRYAPASADEFETLWTTTDIIPKITSMELITYTPEDTFSFLVAAEPLWRSQPIAANLPWGLALSYIRKEGRLQQMLAIYQGGKLAYVGLQTDADRPLILIGPKVASSEAQQLLQPHIHKAAGFIGLYDLAESLQPVFPRLLRNKETMLLYQLDELSDVAPKSGQLLIPNESHQELLADWIEKFLIDVDQIGGSTDYQQRARDMIVQQDLRLLLADGQPVSMAGSNRSAGGVACINYVYTPPKQRGKGFAFRCVGLYCRELLQAHQSCCLYAEEANPISNHVYRKLGFEIVDRSVEVEW